MTEDSIPRHVVRLQHIAMLQPTAEFIYAPDGWPAKKFDYAEFLEKFADRPHVIQVSFADDGVSDPQPVTAYANGLDCWYIVAGEVGR